MKLTKTIRPVTTILVALACVGTLACSSEPPARIEVKADAPRLLGEVAHQDTVLSSTLAPPKAAPEPRPEVVTVTTALNLEPAADESLADEPTPSVPSLESHDGLTVRRLITAPDVEHREPVSAASSFVADGEPVYAFIDIENASEMEQAVVVNFIGPAGQVRGGAELTIPATVPRWRTWARTRLIHEAGAWRVEIRTKGGALLGSLPFEVVEGR